jgi:GT2 family glycosyltransferase
VTQVSIVVPCHNDAATLRAALDSALAQRDVDFDVVLIDDGSTDGSLAIAREYEPHVRVLSRAHAGVSAARNAGIAATSSEWVVFLDADDMLLPRTLRARLDASTDADVVICDWEDVTERGGHLAVQRVRSMNVDELAADAELACAHGAWATTAALMYRRELVERIGGFREELRLIQDARFLFDAARCAARFSRSAHVGARYRIHSGSHSRRDPAMFWTYVFRNGVQIAALWQAERPLTASRRRALEDILNGAAHGLFFAGDRSFREPLAALRRFGAGIAWRNRLAEALAGLVGQRMACGVAGCWRATRLAELPRLVSLVGRRAA